MPNVSQRPLVGYWEFLAIAGVDLLLLQIGFLGRALALAVSAISWVKKSAPFLILAVVFFVGLAMAFWSYWAMHIQWTSTQDGRISRSGKRQSGREPQ